jgi:hypothetical protein
MTKYRLRGWAKDVPPEEFWRCPICRDPNGGMYLSVTHTYDDGCREWWLIMEKLSEVDW